MTKIQYRPTRHGVILQDIEGKGFAGLNLVDFTTHVTMREGLTREQVEAAAREWFPTATDFEHHEQEGG